jgi:hypothetical protein
MLPGGTGVAFGDPITIPLKRPLVDVKTAAAAMGTDEDGVLQAIEDGKIPWAFNVALPRTNRRCLRILSKSLSEFLSGKEILPTGDRDFPVIFGLIFPLPIPTVKATVVRQRLLCSQFHVANLIRAGCFAVSKSCVRRGPGSSAEIERASVSKFLLSRRIK